MANIIKVNGTLEPTALADPTHRDIYGEGGLRSVTSLTEMGDIPAELRKDGMQVWVIDDSVMYQYDAVLDVFNTYSPTMGVGSVGSNELATNAVISSKIEDGAVGPNKIGSEAVIAGNIADDAVVAGNLAIGSVDLQALDPSAVGAFIPAFVGVPATSNAIGVEGTLAYDTSHLYICLVGAEVGEISGSWGRIDITTGWV